METKHHRKPRSIGGTDCTKNISIVPKQHHRAWHHLFSNLSATEIAVRMGKLFPDFFFISVPNVYMTRLRIPSCKSYARSKKLQDKSIDILWSGLGMKRIVENINDRWIDPDFHIVHLKKTSP